jgi:hypothetical protein
VRLKDRMKSSLDDEQVAGRLISVEDLTNA